MITTSGTPPSGSVWSLRAMATILMCGGVLPLVAFGEGRFGLTPALLHWISWTIVICGAALLLARLLPRMYEELLAYALQLLLRPSSRTFALLAAALTTGLTLFFSWRLLWLQGASIDEFSQQWQGALLASGRLFARVEPHPEFFSTMQTVEVDGRWFPHFPIGGGAVQAVGILLGVPWLINPLLAGYSAVAVYQFVAATASEAEARGTALLFALSPFVLFIAGSKLDHVATLAAVWTAIAMLPRWAAASTARDARRGAAVIGAALGIAAMIRPYHALLAALVIGTFQLFVSRGNTILLRSLLIQIVAGAVPVALLLAANHATTGGFLTFGYDVLDGPAHRPGFHVNPYGQLHTPLKGVRSVSIYLMRLNVALLCWPVPVVAVVAIAMGWQRRVSRWDQLLLALLAITLGGYVAYWGVGLYLESPRFLYLVAPVFLLYVARFPVVMRERVRSPVLRTAVTLLLPLWMLVAWLAPPSRTQPFGVWSLAERVAQDRPVATQIAAEVARQQLTHAVVFVDDGWHARLSARLRALGVRPFAAQFIVGHKNACALQRSLDSVDNHPSFITRNARLARVLAEVRRVPARAVPGLNGMEQLALQPGELLTGRCMDEWKRARPFGADLSRLLPLETLDDSGRLGGNVVYARDFGARNELLRGRFGDREWYVARVAQVAGDSVSVTVKPFKP